MTKIKRRLLLKGTVSAASIALAAGAGLLRPRELLAAWPEKAFKAEETEAALNRIYGKGHIQASKDIQIQVPEIAENGAVVPVTVTTSIPGAESIAVAVSKNTNPLAAVYRLHESADGYISTRLKMAGTSDVIATVKAGDKIFSARKEVKVTIGGCGG